MNKRSVLAFVAGMAVCGCICQFFPGQPEKTAVAAPTAGSSSDVMAITTDSPSGTQLLYLIDARQQVFSVYEFDTKRTKLKLAAVRQYSLDHQLQEYNTESPTVSEIEKLVRPR